MRLRRFGCVLLAFGLVLAFAGAISPLVFLRNVSVIGGADWPTYTAFLMRGWPFCALLLGGSLTVGGLFCLVFSKTIESCCGVRSTAISLGISAIGALGLNCLFFWYTMAAFHERNKHPVGYPVCIMAGILAFLGLCALCWGYWKVRKDKVSGKGIVIDILTVLDTFPALFFCFSYIIAAF